MSASIVSTSIRRAGRLWSVAAACALALQALAAAHGGPRRAEEQGRAEGRGRTEGQAGEEGASADGLQEARHLLEDGRYPEAERAARARLERLDASGAGDSPEAAEALELLSEALRRAGRILDPATRASAERAVAIRLRTVGAGHPDHARSLVQLAQVARAAGAYREAEPLYRQALAIQERVLGSSHPDLAATLKGLGSLSVDLSRYTEAKEFCRRALELRERALGPEHPEVAEGHWDLGRALFLLDELSETRSRFERALAIQEKTLRPDHPDRGGLLAQLGRFLQFVGEKEPARALIQEALEIQERALRPDHPALAHTLISLGWNLVAAEEPAAARPFFERAIAIRERALGPDHPYLALAIGDLAFYEWQMGEYPAARAHYERAIAIYEKVPGPDSGDLALQYGNLGILLWHTGDWGEARRLFERTLAIDEKIYGPVHTSVAFDLNALALLSGYQGDYAAARRLHERALAIREKILGPEHLQVAASLNNLAMMLHDMGDDATTAPMAQRAISIYEKSEPGGSHEMAIVLHTLAVISRDTDDLKGARPLFERATAMMEKVSGPDHPVLAEMLNDQGEMLALAGEREAARQAFERALRIREQALSPKHPYVATSLASLARLDLLSGRTAEARGRAMRAEKIIREQFVHLARGLSEREALRYEEIRTSGLDVALSVVAEAGPPPPGAVAEVWDELVRSRALVLDEMASRSRSLAGGEGAEVAAQAAALDRARARLARLVVGGPGPGGPERYREEVQRAQEEKERAERILAGRSAIYREERARGGIGLTDVLRALPPDTALVAYVQYRRPMPPGSKNVTARQALEGEPRYLALAVKPGGEDPHAVDLGPVAEIDARIRHWREEAGGPPPVLASAAAGREAGIREAGGRLRRFLWDPVARSVEGARRVLVVPDGAISLVSLAALPASGGGYLVEHGPVLHYLSAERDLARAAASSRGGNGLLVVGGPDYDARPDARAAAPGSREASGETAPLPAGTALGRASLYRGGETPCGSALDALRFQPLTNALREADEVESLWRERSGKGRAAGGEIVKLVGAGAGEAEFKRGAVGRRVLHLATHGFFGPGECATGQGSGKRSAGASASAAPLAENPLLFTGLALAGANRRGGAAGAGGDDGILTAEEVAALDLSGVEWAVLSACETGVGEVQAGEGVLGLRRAFEVAGVGAMIMSLWPVEDQATREWMRHLYEGRLEGKSTADAVRAASLAVLEARRRAGRGTHPFYWGAFVAAGDWR